MILTTENEAVIPINFWTTSKPTLNYQLTIINNRSYTIYYKITTPQSDIVLLGNTGSISANTTSTIMFKIYFPITTSPQDLPLQLDIGLYSDGGYTNLIDASSFTIMVHFIDLNTVNVIGKWNFSNGSTQGWSGGSVDNSAFADPYSISSCIYNNPGTVQVTSPAVTLPSTGNIWFIFAYKVGGPYSSPKTYGVHLSFGSFKIKDITNISLDNSQWYIFAIKVTQNLGNTDKFYVAFDLTQNTCAILDDIYIVSL